MQAGSDAKSIMRVEPRGNRRIGNGNLRMCERTHIYTQEKPKERAHNKIDLLFGENNTTVIVPDAAVDLLHKTVYPICEGFIQSATVDMGNGIKGKISITTKGIVKVTRTKTNTSTYEA